MEISEQPDGKLKSENTAKSDVGDFLLYSAEDLAGSTGFGAKKDLREEMGTRQGGQVSSIADGSLGTSGQGCIDIFEDPGTAYDAAVNDGDTCLVVNAQDDEEINLYSDIEGDQTKTAEEILPGESIPAKEEKKSSFKNETQSCVRNQVISDNQDREEGELTPEPVPTGKSAKSGGDQSLRDKAPTDGSINSVLEEFNKRLAIIQEEAKLKSLELQKSFAEKLKLPGATALLPGLQGSAESPVFSENTQVAASKPDGPSDARGRSEAKEARAPKEQTNEAREPDTKVADPEETCIDCIAEKLRRARGGNRGHRGRSATSSRGRSRSRSRSRSSSKDRFGRQKRRNHRRSTETRVRRPENRGIRTRSESRPRNDAFRGPRRDRREMYARKPSESKAASPGDIKIEKQRVKTLVKRQMKFISDVIDNPNPKTSGSSHYKEGPPLRAKRTPVSDHGEKSEGEKLPGISNELYEMEKFLEQLRDINRKKVTRSDEYTRLKKAKARDSAASGPRSGPAQSRISIRAPLDDIMNSCGKDKGLYFSSTSRRRAAPKRRGSPTENSKTASQRSRAVERQESENIAKGPSRERKNSPSFGEKEETRQKEAKVQRREPARRSSSRRPRSASASPPSSHSDGSETLEERISSRQRENVKGCRKTKADDRNRASQRQDKRGEPVKSAIPDSSDLSDSSAASNDVPETHRRQKVRNFRKGGPETENRSKMAKKRHTEAVGRLAKSGERALEIGDSEIESSTPEEQPKKVARRVTRSKKHQSESSEVENVSPERKSTKKRKPRREVSESSRTSSETDAKSATGESFASEERSARRRAIPAKKRKAKLAQMLLGEGKGSWRHSRSRSLASFSGESQAPPPRRRKKKLIVVGKNRREKFVVDPELCRLLFRGRNKRAVVVKARKERQTGLATKTPAKCRSRSASAQQGTRSRTARKRRRSEEGSDSGPTLDELEAFLAKLREKRKDRPAEEFYPELEVQSLRRESAFLDRHRAKRKAKLMACVAVTDKASAKEARFLEALKKSKDEHDIEKEKIIRKLKAGSDAIFLASVPKSGEKSVRDHERTSRAGEKKRRSASLSSRKSDSGAKPDESTYKPFDVSFAFKNTARKSLANAVLTTPNPGESLASNKAQALLNTLRAKKKAKKGQQEAEDKAHED